MTIKPLVLALSLISGSVLLTACQSSQQAEHSKQAEQQEQKPVVYQVFTRLFGNTNTNNVPWGTLAQNGVGKFEDFTPKALSEIKAMGVTHVWYTGVLHHALVADYSAYGIGIDDPDVVKGRAGSPYAIKDYYNVNPDLAKDPAKRLAEFEALIERTHDADMKVVIDIVPNHVARNYQSLSAPQGAEDFGAQDNTSLTYARDNNFYYVTGQDFKVPTSADYQVLGGKPHPLADSQFTESPAKWTGNGARAAQPHIHDWYETVKVNYGVRPDGSYDFPTLPAEMETQDYRAHHAFWQDKDLPDSWYKFRDITLYWLDKGVDGFRYDMAEMVPVEFWSFLNSSIKMQNPDAFLLAEVYNPTLYRPYIHQGKMDFLYDKVGFYDSLKLLMQGTGNAQSVMDAHLSVSDIAPHMLHFLENHDEQRIASAEFAGSAEKGKPAMVVSHLISKAPTMLYFGQSVGEDGSEMAGFGKPSRTSIFDYIGVPAHQAWMNNGKFDGGLLSDAQKALRQYYKKLMNLSSMPAIQHGALVQLNTLDSANKPAENVMAFARDNAAQQVIVASNFDADNAQKVTIELPEGWQGKVVDKLESHPTLVIKNNQLNITLAPLASVVYELEN
ncbi:alpha-amylase family glycosyl hydrolase [Pseudoalteromonas luteoviolacea]|uniref:Alpha-amylase n=1 Tax=Pseudoalteromonas luteoviolacea S4054 TaxID=1129367 RepID=A0A0F6A6A4_9GAMM|nr:alpha-amylase family glycosyl hydrolase [Pseudoalteromonas luteoviolacea]AOT07616.1 alpha-amylase [Pseudoalteromonas luteoviolacea]AOT12532.1 alpha-amylase [Pseudoalteromonas luteoviolacea]AOT17446.1 alpha-amylase [Pseudoalteromonas luteoviolacea]KKE81356.1 alpha-amylase [Pseudoalteromonas luteoviolacea S4054]KZN70635.1 alpha-amylase [Pseudoalteromonas luteoviolacea S4047-1]